MWTDHEVCIGCKTCCDHSALTMRRRTTTKPGYMLKCDMCKAELVAGGASPSASPAAPCARSISARAEDMIAKYGEGERRGWRPAEGTTHPNLIMNPHRDAQKSGSGTGALVNLEEEI